MLLLINAKACALSQGTSFKLTRENPLLTNAGDYTFDVELPMSAPQNLEIFGNISLPEASRAQMLGVKMPFELLTPPLLIRGQATVISVTQESVKLQLLAGRSALKAAMTDREGKDRYIDELDLGYFTELLPTAIDSRYNGNLKTESAKRLYAKALQLSTPYETDFSDTNNELRFFNGSDESGCVFYPIYRSAEKTLMNNHADCHYPNGERDGENENTHYGWGLIHYQTDQAHFLRPGFKIAPQPLFYKIFELVVKSLGFSLPESHALNNSDVARRIFIANSRPTALFAQMLPHWTVAEFFEQVSLFFGVDFDLNAQGQLRVYSRLDQETFQQRTHYINEVYDNFVSEYEDGEQGTNDPRIEGLAYRFPNEMPKQLVLPDDVWERATVQDIDGESFGEQFASPEDDWSDMGGVLIRETEEGQHIRTYAYLSNLQNKKGWHEVDCLGGRHPKGSRKAKVELKIVPCMIDKEGGFMCYGTKKYYDKGLSLHLEAKYDYGVPLYEGNTRTFRLTTTDAYTATDAENTFSIDAYIKGKEQNAPTKPDCIEVGLAHATLKTSTATTLYADPKLYERPETTRSRGFFLTNRFPVASPMYYDSQSGLYQDVPTAKRRDGSDPYSRFFCLREPVGQYTSSLAKMALSSRWGDSDVRIRSNFTFRLPKAEISPTDIFIIRGRTYRCLKLEYIITDTGLEPTISGEFIEIRHETENHGRS